MRVWTLVIVLLWQSPAQAAPPSELCGAYCLYLGLKSIDLPIESLERLQEKLGDPPPGGYSLGQIEEQARKLGAQTLGVRTTLEKLKLRKERFACIAHVQSNHFVLLTDIGEQGVTVIDVPEKRQVPFLTWSREWDGAALLLSPGPLTPEEQLRHPWNWRLMSLIAGGVLVVVAGGSYLRKRFSLGSAS